MLGFELEQLPPDMAEAAGLPQQQATDDDGDEDEDMSRQLHSLRSSAGQLGGKMRRDYKEAADKLRSRLATGRQQSKVRRAAAAAVEGRAGWLRIARSHVTYALVLDARLQCSLCSVVMWSIGTPLAILAGIPWLWV